MTNNKLTWLGRGFYRTENDGMHDITEEEIYSGLIYDLVQCFSACGRLHWLIIYIFSLELNNFYKAKTG